MGKKISVANLVMLAGGAVTLLFSFFDFYYSFSAWSTDGLAFVSTVPAILALAMVGWSAAELAGAGLPQDILTFNPAQLKATWGIAAAGMMLAWLTVDGDKGIGFWLMLLGSLAMAAGAVMGLLGKGTDMVTLGGGTSMTANNPFATGGPSAPPPPPPPPPGPSAPPPPPPPPVA